MYQYIIEAPSDVKSVQITGTFDNWSKSLPEITSPPFEQTITLPEKQDIIFKFIIDGNWTTLDSYPVVADENGNTNNIVHAEHLILVEEEEEEEPGRDDSFKLDDEGSAVVQIDNPVALAVTDCDETETNVHANEAGDKQGNESEQIPTQSQQVPAESFQVEEDISEYAVPEKLKQGPTVTNNNTGIDPTSSSSSFAAVSSPPTSSDFEHIGTSPSPEESTPHEVGDKNGEHHTSSKSADSTQKLPTVASTVSSKANAVPEEKPEKPTLLAHPSESTLRAPTSSGTQTPVIASSSSSTTSPNEHEDSPKHTPRIPGSYDTRPSVERHGSGSKREGLISKFKNLFK